jgi:hypothetical protein
MWTRSLSTLLLIMVGAAVCTAADEEPQPVAAMAGRVHLLEVCCRESPNLNVDYTIETVPCLKRPQVFNFVIDKVGLIIICSGFCLFCWLVCWFGLVCLHCIVLYCIVLYCIVLYRSVVYYLVLYGFVLLCIVLYCFVLFCIVLYCFVLFCLILSCFLLFSLVLYCFVLFCVLCLYCFGFWVLYCFVLFCIVCIVLYCFVLFCMFCIVLYCFVLFCIVLFCFVCYVFVCLFVCLWSVGVLPALRCSASSRLPRPLALSAQGSAPRKVS